ncbi:MAG: sigma-70 family RNA polymerase sigma factor [Lachnospiraceae bacterium]|nr:sigma-70 family RNA polymerase sigma factor [Lachnospiraceae bacterium]
MKTIQWILRLLKNPGKEIFDENVLYYIGGADVLPPPLDSKREEEMIRLLATERAAEAKQTLIEHNLRLVVYIAKRFDNTGVGVEDLISIGTIGLLKSINTYKSDKNIKLATYASRCIENEILMYLRRTSKNKAEVSIDEPLNTDFDGNELLLGDILGTDEDLISQNLEREAEHSLLCRSIDRLSKREKTIVCLRFGLRLEPEKEGKGPAYPVEEGKEMTQKEVAALLGISQSYISRLEKKIMLRLRKEMLKES